jgi:riboflavin kinase/FMN adenylyltransferase
LTLKRTGGTFRRGKNEPAFMTTRPPSSSAFTVVRNGDPVPERIRGAFVAIGNFDGVHTGHRAVIDAAIAHARKDGKPALALTFEPHPRAFFQPDRPLFRLTPEAAKLELLAAAGLDGAVVMTFGAALAKVTAEDFVADILVGRLSIASAVAGADFHFGKGRQGTPDFLRHEGKRLGFVVDLIPPFLIDGKPVSSSDIRDSLSRGEVERAGALLGYPWFISGKVIHGEARGRDLGFPTANIALDPACTLAQGIYAVRVLAKGAIHDGVASFGRRPTFGGGAPLLEIYLFDFSGDLYDEGIVAAFIGWIRPELRFDAVGDLVQRMKEDSALAREKLARAGCVFPPIGGSRPGAPRL